MRFMCLMKLVEKHLHCSEVKAAVTLSTSYKTMLTSANYCANSKQYPTLKCDAVRHQAQGRKVRGRTAQMGHNMFIVIHSPKHTDHIQGPLSFHMEGAGNAG